MKIYLEYIFIVNFLLDFMILYGTKRILKINKSNIRILISSIVGSFTTILLFFNITNSILLLVKIILSLIMIIISFGLTNILENTFYFYLISILLGGLIYLFDLRTNPYLNMMIIISITPVVVLILLLERKNLKLHLKDKYLVTIYYKNKEYKLEGFIDTGNRLKSPISNKPIILVNLKLPLENVLYVPFKALNTNGILPCIKPDKIEIDGIKIDNCLIGISKDKFSLNGLNCILPNKLKEIL